MRLDALQLEDESHEDPIRELALALAVVEQALRDIQNATRRAKYRGMKASALLSDRQAADDARDFVLNRLWEDGNYWGEVLRLYGVQRLTVARLCHGMRNLETTNERRRNKRWNQSRRA